MASGAGRSAITVLRISGPEAGVMLGAICGKPPNARVASLRPLRNADGALLDQALTLWFPGPNSYTGEDSAELHLHGGRAVLAGVAERLLDLGARPAEAGEFTRRAFLNGRMDLTEAEAVADLVAAETSGQAAQALLQMQGALGKQYRAWSDRLVRLLAGLEALIDFPDEHIPPEVEASTQAEIAALAGEMDLHLNDARRGELLREGLVCAIVGPPNAGKSTLINALSRREIAIVSPTPGTTRDVLEARVDFGGVPVTLLDTAGLHDGSGDAIEVEGMRRARMRAETADIVVVVRDATAAFQTDIMETTGRVVYVVNKIDLIGRERISGILEISAHTGFGLDRLEATLTEVTLDLTRSSGPPPLTRARHRAALTEAAARLHSAASAPLPELQAEDIRLAMRCIGRVVGLVGVEEILDFIFGQFCIGK